MPSILIINPNSSSSITDTLQDYLKPPPDFTYSFFTGPADSCPSSVDDNVTADQSAQGCIQALISLIRKHDAFLVSCYSDHPLVGLLKSETTKPVLDIFHASIIQSLALQRGKCAIVTTGKPWERILDDAVVKFLGASSDIHFTRTYSTGLGVLELHGLSFDVVAKRIGECAKQAIKDGAKVVCLGCAGMSGLEKAVVDAVGNEIKIIDGVVAGTNILVGLLRSGL